MQQTYVRHYCVNRRDLVYLKFIMEAHEGLATLSTADKLKSIIRISYDSCFAPTVESLICSLQQDVEMVEIP